MQTRTEEQALNPFPWYRSMREARPVYYNPQYRFWQVFRYDDVQRVLSDYTSFSSAFGGGGQGRDPLSSSLISMDPPRHRQLRNLVTQAFTPRSVAQLSERITAIINALLDQVAARGHMDIVDDLSYPLPVIVIAEMLGIPQEDRERFKVWSDAVVGATYSERGNPQAEMSEYFLDMIQQRGREPQNDLISALLDAQIDGQHLNQRELLGFCILLLVAGNETTTNLIGNALLCFDEHPEVMEELRADRFSICIAELLPISPSEIMRCERVKWCLPGSAPPTVMRRSFPIRTTSILGGHQTAILRLDMAFIFASERHWHAWKPKLRLPCCWSDFTKSSGYRAYRWKRRAVTWCLESSISRSRFVKA